MNFSKIIFARLFQRHNDHHYRAPVDLAVTPMPMGKGLVIGSCFADGLARELRLRAGLELDYILYQGIGKLTQLEEEAQGKYDYQLVLLPLRLAMHEDAYNRLEPSDEAGYEKLFEEAKERVGSGLEEALIYNKKHKLLTFVANFLTPQQPAMGRLLPRNTLGNPVYFIGRLNEWLADEIRKYTNVYLMDIDGIANSVGKKRLLDESMWLYNHGTWLNDWDWDYDQKRLEKPMRPTQHYELSLQEFFMSTARELVAACRTLRQVDAVKMVVVDLDDTLWRGVLAEEGTHHEVIGGWPTGIAEALRYLKKRGILLAVISKNDEGTITKIWREVYGQLILPEDFAIRRINWRPKPENMAEVLQEANLLPKNVVYIDDNPVERAAMKESYPDIRVLGGHLYYLRRILLWAPETQVAQVTKESAERTQMVQAQVKREESRKKLSREEFLASLRLEVTMSAVREVGDQRFARGLELLNKTNQFNTTGKRWKLEEWEEEFAQGTTMWTFEVRDIYTRYGIVAVAVARGNTVAQMVMSCRVVGLDAELAAMSAIENDLAQNGHAHAEAEFVETQANLLCRDFYERCGWEKAGNNWRKTLKTKAQIPAHIKMVGTDERVEV